MRTLKSRNVLIVVLSFILALSVFAFAGTIKPVSASSNVTLFEIVESADIRLGTGEDYSAGASGSGMRFAVKMDEATARYVKDTEGVELGFLVTPKKIFDHSTKDVADLSTFDFISGLKNPNGDDKAAYLQDKNNPDKPGVIANKSSIGREVEGSTEYFAKIAFKGIFEQNVELGYTLVAYITDGTDTVYAYPDGYASTYKQAASRAYMSGANTLEAIKGAAHLTAFATEDDPVQITDASDLALISSAVAGTGDAVYGETFDNAYFKVMESIVVDGAFAAIGEDFAGKIDMNDNTIEVYNNPNGVFAGTVEVTNKGETVTMDTVIAQNTKIFNATEKSAGRYWGVGYTNAEFVAAEDLPTDVVNDVNYQGNAIKVTGKNNINYFVKQNYTKAQMEAKVAENDAIKFSFLAHDTDSIYPYIRNLIYVYDDNTQTYNLNDEGEEVPSSQQPNVFAGAGLGIIYDSNNKVADSTKTLKADKQRFLVNRWYTMYMPAANIIGAFDTSKDGETILNFAYLCGDDGRINFNVDFYIGDIEFVKEYEFPTVADFGVVDLDTTNFDTERLGERFGTTSQLAVYSRTDTYTVEYADSTELQALEGVDNTKAPEDAVVMRNVTGQWVTFLPAYTSAEYKLIAKREGYTHVKFSYMVYDENTMVTNEASSATSPGLLSRIGIRNNGNNVTATNYFNKFVNAKVWNTEVLTIDQFVSAFNRDELFFINLGTTNGGADVYIGDIEFLTQEPVDAVYRGKIGFNVDAYAEEAVYSRDSTDQYAWKKMGASTYASNETLVKAKADMPTDAYLATYYADFANESMVKYVPGQTSQTYVLLPINYTKTELTAMYEAEKINAIKLSYMVETDATSVAERQKAMTLLGQAGISNYTLNRWQDLVIPFSAYANATACTEKVITLTSFAWTGGTYHNFYLGDIEFVKLDNTTHTPYEGSFSLKLDTLATMPASGWKNSATGNFAIKTTTYVTAEETNALPFSQGWHAYTNTRGSMKFTPVTVGGDNNYVGLKLPHTKAEYLALTEKYEVNAVKFTYAVQVNTAAVPTVLNWSWSNDTRSILSGAGYHAASEPSTSNPMGTKLPTNMWQTEIISLNNLAAAMQKDPWLFVASLSRCIGASADNPITLYVAEFEMYTATEDEFSSTGSGQSTTRIEKDPVPYRDWFTPSASQVGIGLESHDASYSETYLTPEEVANLNTSLGGVYTVNNDIGYTGGAIRIGDCRDAVDSTVSPRKGGISGAQVGVKSPYSAEELQALYEAGYFKGATLTFYIMIGSPTNYARNNDQRSFNWPTYQNDWSVHSLMSVAGYRAYTLDEYGNSVKTNASMTFDANKWHKVTIDLDNPYFFTTIRQFKNYNLSARNNCFNVVSSDNGVCDVYIGNFIYTPGIK